MWKEVIFKGVKKKNTKPAANFVIIIIIYRGALMKKQKVKNRKRGKRRCKGHHIWRIIMIIITPTLTHFCLHPKPLYKSRTICRLFNCHFIPLYGYKEWLLRQRYRQTQ
uniref:Uncharacterized protein n=1 Tax=Trypanosoma vivax (strain Y486) TaxID=1055687 RepID=G0TUB0_TRYVY|nr:hypothetical protein, unlikely [Trypanosoma vivax Y486]